MAGSTAKLAVEVVANAVGLDRGLSRAQRSLTNFDKTANNVARSTVSGFRSISSSAMNVGAALTGLSVGGGFAGLASGLKSSIDRLDEIGDQAKGIDTTAESLSRIGFIATKIGSSSDAAVGGIQKMQRALGDAATKGGPAADMIAALGLDIDALITEDPTQAFLDIALAVGQLSTASERAAAASAIFGKSSKDLMQFFVDPAEIYAASVRFDELHGNIEEAANIAGVAKSSMDDLTESIKGLGEQLVISLGPDVTKLINNAADSLGRLNKSGGVEGAYSFLKELPGAISDRGNDLFSFGGSGKKSTASTMGGYGSFGEMYDGFTGFFTGWLDSIDSYQRKNQPGAGENLSGPNIWETMTRRDMEIPAGSDVATPQTWLDASRARVEAARRRAEGIEAEAENMAAVTEANDARLQQLKQEEQAAQGARVSLKDLQAETDKLGEAADSATGKIEKQAKALNDPTDLGYSNLGMSGPIGGDIPGMSSEAYDRFLQYNTLPGGFVGDSIPPNMRTFTPPEWGSRQVDFRSNYTDNAQAYGMDENNNLLRRIADSIENVGMVG